MNNLNEVIKDLKEVVPELSNKTMTFRLLDNADLFCLFDGSRNEDFNKNLGWGTPKDENEIIEIFHNQNHNDQVALFSVCNKYKGTWLGVIKYEIISEELMIAIWTHPDYWKTGIAYKMSCTGVEIIFNHTTQNKIHARIKHDNKMMKQYVEKTNFKLLRNDKVFHITSESYFECLVYQAIKENWKFKYPTKNIKEN